MSSRGISSEELSKKLAEHYGCVNAYMGAFACPTLGHYESMRSFAIKTLMDNPTGKVLMLFMPTHKNSSEKPHLSITYQQRIKILQFWCVIIMEEIGDPRLTVEVSDIESFTPSSATIHTIRELHTRYPGTEVFSLSMGLDNGFQLIYWELIEEYIKYINGKIYVVDRDIEGDKSHLITCTNGIVIDGIVPAWSRLQGKVPSDFVTKNSDGTYSLKGVELPPICRLPKPIDTSSSMVRAVLHRCAKSDSPEEKLKLDTILSKMVGHNIDGNHNRIFYEYYDLIKDIKDKNGKSIFDGREKDLADAIRLFS